MKQYKSRGNVVTVSQVSDDGTVIVIRNNIKVEAMWVRVSQIADDGTVSVL